MDFHVTENQIDRVRTEWSRYAKEEVFIEIGDYVTDPIYAFGSELACLRIYRVMNGTGQVKYSEYRKSWFYCNKD